MTRCTRCKKVIKNPRRKTVKFCSIICSNKSRTIADRYRKCKQCNNPFMLKNIAYEKRGGGKYCSKQCSRFASKKHKLNEHFFDYIDTQEKAYWLGFCMADAYNSGSELIINLAIIDKNHLQKMYNSLESDRDIKLSKDSKFATARFGSRILCQSLIKLGCIPKKSLTLQYPDIDPIYNKHFIRGVFDGDGCCHQRKNDSSIVWSIYSGSPLFIKTIYKILSDELQITLNVNKKENTISTAKKTNIALLHNYFYNNASIFLERKRDKFFRNDS